MAALAAAPAAAVAAVAVAAAVAGEAAAAVAAAGAAVASAAIAAPAWSLDIARARGLLQLQVHVKNMPNTLSVPSKSYQLSTCMGYYTL